MYVATLLSVGINTPKNSCTTQRSLTSAPPTHGWMNVGLTVVVVITAGVPAAAMIFDVANTASRAVGADTVTPTDAALPPCGQPKSMYLTPAVMSPKPSTGWPLTFSVASSTGTRSS